MKHEASQESDPQTYAIIFAAMAVHSELGAGFLEAVYQDAIKFELEDRRISAQDQVKLRVHNRGKLLESHYLADFICYESEIVELKAQSDLTVREEAQLLNYLKTTNCQRGRLINFGRSSLQYKRMIRSSAS